MSWIVILLTINILINVSLFYFTWREWKIAEERLVELEKQKEIINQLYKVIAFS